MTGIYQVYTCHISSAARFLAVWVPAARRAESDLDARLILSFFCDSDQKPCDSRLGPAKVPQPGVDLVNMAAPARSLARSVSTAECKGLLLSRSILVWTLNSRCGVSVKKALKEWNQPKKVLNSADIEGRDRRGLVVQFPNSKSICLHGAKGLKVQILKGTKEHKVKSNFV